MVKNYLLHFYIACFSLLSFALKASNNDIVATGVNAPCLFVFTSQAFIPAALFVNNGNDIVSDILFHASIYNENKELVYEDEFFLKEFSPNVVKLVQFNKTYQANTSGKFTLTVKAIYVQDTDTSNNSINKEFEIRSEDLSPSAGNALQFDGKSSVTLNAKIPQNQFTIEAWVCPRDIANEGVLISSDNDSANEFKVIIKGVIPEVSIKTDKGIIQFDSKVSGKLNTWMHLAIAFNGSNLTMFLNGENVGNVLINSNTSFESKYLTLGSVIGLGGDYKANFAIDNFKLWNTALNLNEIRMGMHLKNPAFSNAKLIQYLRFDEAISSLKYLEDASGNCHAGYFINNAFLDGDSTNKIFSIKSTIPLQNSNGELLSFTNDNRQFTNDKSMNIQFKNFLGNADIVAFKPKDIIGMLPESAVTSVSKNSFNDNWLLYFYGDFRYDNMNVGFGISDQTKNVSEKLTDLYLSKREIGSDQNWSILQNPANSFDQKNNTIYFNIEPNKSLTTQLGIAANIINATLPVKFSSFTASKQLNGIQLNWITASEMNNNYYQIERSSDGKLYEAIGKIKSAGNSNLNQQYTFTDLQAYSLNANKLYYRLGQYDIDGTGNNTNSLEVDLEKEDLIFVHSILPNPFCNKLVLGINSSQEINIRIDIINGNGQNLFHKMVNTEKGYQQINLDEAGNLPIGVYYMRIEYNNIVSLQKLFKLSN